MNDEPWKWIGFERFWPVNGNIPQGTISFTHPRAFVRGVRTQIPRGRPGVYCFLDLNGRPIYIGKAKCLRNRLLSYGLGGGGVNNNQTQKQLAILGQAGQVAISGCPDEFGALVWERELISHWKPQWNRSHNPPPRRFLWLVFRGGNSPKPFQMKAQRPVGSDEYWGPFRGGRWSTTLTRAFNRKLPGLDPLKQRELTLRFLQGTDRALLRIWQKQLGVEVPLNIEAKKDKEIPTEDQLGYLALVRFERWRIKLAQSKGLNGYWPIGPSGVLAWNCAPASGFAYFYTLCEGRVLGVLPIGPKKKEALAGRHIDLPANNGPIGLEEPFMVASWFERFPACAQRFVFAQTSLFSKAAGST